MERAHIAGRRPRRLDPAVYLPRDVQLGVLEYLSVRELARCSALSRAWHDVCYDGKLWQSINTDEFYSRISSEQLARLVGVGGNFVKELILRGCTHIHVDDAMAIGRSVRNLRFLSLEGCRFFDHNSLTQMVKSNPQLEHIDIAGVATATNTTCFAIGSFCQNLTYLDTSFCQYIDSSGIFDIVRTCGRLQHVKISGCRGIDDRALMKALRGLPDLARLDMAECKVLTDDSVRVLVSGSTEPIPVHGQTQRPTVEPLRSLTHLNLSRCKRLTNRTLADLAHAVPNLQVLEVAGVLGFKDEGFSRLLPTLNELYYLDCEGCKDITDDTLVSLWRAPFARKLKHLQLSSCDRISSQGVCRVLRRCIRLQNLELDNTSVNDTVVVAAIRVTRRRMNKLFDHLETPAQRHLLARVGVQELNDVLLRVSVYDCPSITWESVYEVMRRNSETRVFSVDGVSTATCKPIAITAPMATKTGGTLEQLVNGLARAGDADKASPCPLSPADSIASSSPASVATSYSFARTASTASSQSDDDDAPRFVELPMGLIRLKCYYGWQKIVDTHFGRVSRGEYADARRLEHEWAEWMSGDAGFRSRYHDTVSEQRAASTDDTLNSEADQHADAAAAAPRRPVSSLSAVAGAVGAMTGGFAPDSPLWFMRERRFHRRRHDQLLAQIVTDTGADENAMSFGRIVARRPRRNGVSQCAIA
ncbi:uncharacterized protein V1510DRAFT_398513 [Dipodascopsis tothii]|uniref:uncharacterized protein n=1 Tax=Dipodascopsis tothii TaxID=44089 RepID=UPI0034CEAE46